MKMTRNISMSRRWQRRGKPPAPQGGGEKPGAGDAGSSGTDGTSGSDSQIYGMDGGIVNGDPVASGGDTGSAGSASIPV